MTATIYHNPKCGTSRNTLAFLRAAGIAPTIVEYLQTPLTAAQIQNLADAAGVPVRSFLRAKESLADELGLNSADAQDADILAAMAAHPLLLNRPIVVTAKGTKLCRPSEEVFALIDIPPGVRFVKEDGADVTPKL